MHPVIQKNVDFKFESWNCAWWRMKSQEITIRKAMQWLSHGKLDGCQ